MISLQIIKKQCKATNRTNEESRVVKKILPIRFLPVIKVNIDNKKFAITSNGDKLRGCEIYRSI